ncbi:MAG TPA: glycine betaine ABC transporter substrate-binding protein [Phycisphaerae bacterium]|nr:glycine betaine ABC transporter substrate-binding protein [Phycisphaerae bacterium]
MRAVRLLVVVATLLGAARARAETAQAAPTVTVASKKFTESVILGEIARQLAAQAGADAQHRAELGGTRVLWNALRSGDIDIYPDYTGTLIVEILADDAIGSLDDLRAALVERGVGMTDPLGFNNTYALGMLAERAKELGIARISDLRTHPELVLGFSNEFMDRRDGWPGLRAAYGLTNVNARGLDHDVAYEALATGSVDAIDLYATDAKIRKYDLTVLDDDRGYFPRYDAVILYRADLAARAPAVVANLQRLAGKIPAQAMIALNARVEEDRESEARVAADFLAESFGMTVAVRERSTFDLILTYTREHLALVGWSMLAALIVALPLGIAAAAWPRFGQGILAVVGIIQTIPALALLVLLMKPLTLVGLSGIGDTPAIVALFLYSLLPIVRNTHAGLRGITPQLRESAEALGLARRVILWRIELPLASPTILAGIKTAAVINVGFATLGALIGAGGYGQPILTGIRLQDYGLIMQGAVPAAALALIVQAAFEVAERFIVPKGLRLARP